MGCTRLLQAFPHSNSADWLRSGSGCYLCEHRIARPTGPFRSGFQRYTFFGAFSWKPRGKPPVWGSPTKRQTHLIFSQDRNCSPTNGNGFRFACQSPAERSGRPKGKHLGCAKIGFFLVSLTQQGSPQKAPFPLVKKEKTQNTTTIPPPPFQLFRYPPKNKHPPHRPAIQLPFGRPPGRPFGPALWAERRSPRTWRWARPWPPTRLGRRRRRPKRRLAPREGAGEETSAQFFFCFYFCFLFLFLVKVCLFGKGFKV